VGNYQVTFGYVSVDMESKLSYGKLFDVAYNPLPNVTYSLTGAGVIPRDGLTSRCVGYQATSIPSVGLTTVTCVDPMLLKDVVQRIDAYYLSPMIADAIPASGLSTTNGVLLGQVTRANMPGGGGLRDVIIAGDMGGGIYYYTGSTFAMAANGTDDSGVFVI